MTVLLCQNSHTPFPISPDLMLPSHFLHFTSFNLPHLHIPVPLPSLCLLYMRKQAASGNLLVCCAEFC